MRLRAILVIAVLSVTLLQAAGPVKAQARGGAVGGLPASVGGPPGPGTFPSRGRPDNAGKPPSASGVGLDRASAAQAFEVRLGKPQADRAAEKAKAYPNDYELDRNGALAIKGEVLASGLTASSLIRIEKAGFVVVRRSEVEGLGISLTVVTRPGASASEALKKLRRVDPKGNYDLNHVFSESGLSRSQPKAAPRPTSPSGRAVKVGLIDSGVSNVIERDPRVSIARRAFAPGSGGNTEHGTAVAELLARGSGSITIHAADIFGTGPRGGTSEQLLQALGWLARERVPVINISMVGPPNGIVAATVAKFIELGFVIVAPVGNDGAAARLLYPASYPGVIAVSACGSDGRLLPEASRVKRTDFVAVGIASVHDPAGNVITVRGTSFAAPIISRMLAEELTAPNSASSERAIARLRQRALLPKGDRRWFGSGLVTTSD